MKNHKTKPILRISKIQKDKDFPPQMKEPRLIESISALSSDVQTVILLHKGIRDRLIADCAKLNAVKSVRALQ
jgi:hypothetical protein